MGSAALALSARHPIIRYLKVESGEVNTGTTVIFCVLFSSVAAVPFESDSPGFFWSSSLGKRTRMTTTEMCQISEADLLAYGEEDEIRGNLTFRPAVEVLPDTKRTAELKQQKLEMIRKKIEEQEMERKRKEQEEAQRRLREQEAKKLKQQQELKKKEEERKRREEEEQRAKMEGGLDQLLGQLIANQSAGHISVCGIELGSVRLRLLAQALENNMSCQTIDLSRKGLTDEDGVSIANMLKKNKSLRKIELEGNTLGSKSAHAIADALLVNQSLKCLNLEANNLTSGGQDVAGCIDMARSLSEGKSSLCVLSLARNGISSSAGEAFVAAAEKNKQLFLLDLAANDLSVHHLRSLGSYIQRNRSLGSQTRRSERKERFQMFTGEFEAREYIMHVEAVRLETEAIEERRLARMRARLVKWNDLQLEEERHMEEALSDLMTEFEERKLSRKGKKKGKK